MRTLAVLILAAVALPAQDTPVKIDNDQVRVLFATSKPHVKGPMHEHHDNRVMIYLDAGSQTLTDPAGKATASHWKAGEVLWSPGGGLHTSENTSDKPYRIVEIELKKPASGDSAPAAALDPIKLDPKHYRVELENAQVRVVRARYGPHERGPMHEHGANRVVVFLTDQTVEATLPGGGKQQVRGSAGDVRWAGAAQHQEVNLSDQPFEVLSVELKAR
jgi:uncharacterized RmlC-like cupin family protein